MKHPDLNRFSISVPTDCRIPEGWIVVGLKVCENCGGTFFRKAGTEIKFCAPCRSRMLFPPDETVYREALPVVPFHPQRLVHYDDSLQPKKVVARVEVELPTRRKRAILPDWLEKLKSLMASGAILTRAEMVSITGHCDVRSLNSAIIARGIELERAACVWPRQGRGTPMGYYRLVF